TLLISGEALQDRFFSQPANLPPERQSYRGLAGFEFGGKAFLSGHLLAGIRDFPGTLAQGSPPYRGPVISADVSWPLGSWARMRVTGDRDVLYASSLVEVDTLHYRNAYIYHRYLGEIVADLPLRCVGFLSAAFEQS